MINGAVRFARYAVPPNSLGYCGVDEPRVLVEMAAAADVGPDFKQLLRQFNGAMPHIAEIARAAGRVCIFDERVVEAYWLGNSLLRLTNAGRWSYGLLSRVSETGRAGRIMAALFGGTPDGAWQHHTFQVFSSLAVRNEFPDRLEAMDQCRIGWGRVRRIDGEIIWVARSPLVETADGVSLGRMSVAPVRRNWIPLTNLDRVEPGDWVSTHWGWACEKLTRNEVSNLATATLHNLRAFWPAANTYDPGVARAAKGPLERAKGL